MGKRLGCLEEDLILGLKRIFGSYDGSFGSVIVLSSRAHHPILEKTIEGERRLIFSIFGVGGEMAKKKTKNKIFCTSCIQEISPGVPRNNSEESTEMERRVPN